MKIADVYKADIHVDTVLTLIWDESDRLTWLAEPTLQNHVAACGIGNLIQFFFNMREV